MWHAIPNFLLFFFFTLTLHTLTFPKHTYSENDEDEGTDGSNKRNLCVATTACELPVGHVLLTLSTVFPKILKNQHLKKEKNGKKAREIAMERDKGRLHASYRRRVSQI
jgi:hypothetical protein